MFLFCKEAPNNRRAGQAQEQVLATDCESKRGFLSTDRLHGPSTNASALWPGKAGYDSTLKFITGNWQHLLETAEAALA